MKMSLMTLMILTIALLFVGCATQRNYFPPPQQQFHKEFSVQVREGNLDNPDPEVVAEFRIFN